MRRLLSTLLVAAALTLAGATVAPARPNEVVDGYRIGFAAAQQLKQSGRAKTFARFRTIMQGQLKRRGDDSPDFRRGLLLGGRDFYAGKTLVKGLADLK
jgi:hypothetical protein